MHREKHPHQNDTRKQPTHAHLTMRVYCIPYCMKPYCRKTIINENELI